MDERLKEVHRGKPRVLQPNEEIGQKKVAGGAENRHQTQHTGQPGRLRCFEGVEQGRDQQEKRCEQAEQHSPFEAIGEIGIKFLRVCMVFVAKLHHRHVAAQISQQHQHSVTVEDVGIGAVIAFRQNADDDHTADERQDLAQNLREEHRKKSCAQQFACQTPQAGSEIAHGAPFWGTPPRRLCGEQYTGLEVTLIDCQQIDRLELVPRPALLIGFPHVRLKLRIGNPANILLIIILKELA